MATIPISLATTEIIKLILPNINMLFTSAYSYNKGNYSNPYDVAFSVKLELAEALIKDVEYNTRDRPVESKHAMTIQINNLKTTIQHIQTEVKDILQIMTDHPKKWFSSIRQFDIAEQQQRLDTYKRNMDIYYDSLCRVLAVDIYRR